MKPIHKKQRNYKLMQLVFCMLAWCFMVLVATTTGLTAQAASKPTISGATTPGTIKAGSPWNCTGTVQSSIALKSVSGYILNSNKAIVDSYTMNTTAKTFKISGSKIDNNLEFNKLSAGTYYYKLSATNSVGTTTWTSGAFKVSAASKPTISGATTPSTLKVGGRWTCTGTVSSSTALKNVSGYILDSSKKNVDSYSFNTTAKTYKLAGSKIDSNLEFNNLKAGTYYYRITATNGAGTTTWTSNAFKVEAAASKPNILNATTPPILASGKSWTCTGNISSQVPLQSVSGYILNSSKNNVYSYTESTTAKSYNMAGSIIDRNLYFNKLGAGTYYYKISATSSAGTTTWTSNAFKITASVSKPTISGATTPPTMKTGGRWTCTGTVNSTVALKSVSGYILDSNKKTVDSYTVNTSAKSYKLAGTAIDSNLEFNQLKAGTYYYQISAVNSAGTTTWTSNSFRVEASASRPTISGATTPPSMTVGKSWTCTGTITSSIPLQSVSGYILDSSQKAVYNRTDKTTAKNYKMANSVIDKELYFNKLRAGTYYYRISATNSAGTTTWTSGAFKITGSPTTSTSKVAKPIISGATTPSALYKGSSWNCTGTVKSSVNCTVTGYILDTNQKPVKTSTSISGTQVKISGSKIDTSLKFNELGVGRYYYRITASNSAGTTTWTSGAFEVKKSEKIYSNPVPAATLIGCGEGSFEGKDYKGNKHRGVDFSAPVGSPIKALSKGVVVWQGWNKSYGNCVIIKHEDGSGLYSLYAHMKNEALVKKDAHVSAGQKIGEVGKSGADANGYHLHLEIGTKYDKNGGAWLGNISTLRNPKNYINANKYCRCCS